MDGADWLRTQLTSFGCAGCGRAFEMGSIRVLAEREGLFFVDLGCTRCGSQAVAIVTIQEEDAAATGFGDLTPLADDAPVTPGSPAVTADDVIDMHHLLAAYDGDIHGLLRQLDGSTRPLRP
jgi:hypothetical protein